MHENHFISFYLNFCSGLKMIESERFEKLQAVFFGMWVDVMNLPVIRTGSFEKPLLVKLVSRF